MRRLITLKTFTAADLASSDSKTADNTVIMTAGIAATGDMFLFEKYSHQGGEVTEILGEVIRQMKHYRCSRGFIEKNRYESIMKSGKKLVKQGFFGDSFEINKWLNRITLVPHYGTGKQDRIIDAVQPAHRAHNIWFPNHWDDLKQFLMFYPTVEHDDFGDVLEMLLTNASSPAKDVVSTIPTANDYLIEGRRQSASNSRNAKPVSLVEQLAGRPVNFWTGVRRSAEKIYTKVG